jgi:cardiolipin synthase A/B
MRKKSSPTFWIKRTAASTLLGLLVLALTWILTSLTVRLPESDHPIELYANQLHDDLQATYLAAIARAQSSILLIVYSLSDQQIIEALKRKAAEGVEVRVICDAKASPQAARKLGQEIATIKRSPRGLMHQKILVIDAMEVWLGSANMTADSLKMHGNLVAAMQHPEIAAMILQKSLGMGERGVALPIAHRDFLLAGQRLELWFLPDNPEAIDQLTALIDAAQKTVRVAMFTWTHPRLTQAVIDAKQRGLDVQVAIDHYAGKGSSAEVFYRLQQAGVAARLSAGGPLLHHKFLYIDETLLVNGSANWTRAAFTQNDDCFIILHDLNTTQQAFMKELWRVVWSDSLEQSRI